MTEKPVVPRSVRVRVFDENGDIMLVLNREKILPNKEIKDMGFSIPQGSIRPGELPEEAARRELREEAGIEVRELIPVGFDQNPNGIVAEIFDGHGFRYLNGKGPSVAYESEMSGVVEARWIPLPLDDYYIRSDFDGNEYRIYKSTLRSLSNFPLTKPSEKIIKRAVQLRICREGGDAALVLTDGFWELPSTILDPEESPLNGASRLLRELGLSVEKVRLLGEFQNIWIYECLSAFQTAKKDKMGFYAWVPTPLDEDETIQGHKASDLAIWAMEIPSPDPV